MVVVYNGIVGFFVETICSEGRSESAYEKQGTGDRIVLQNGEELLTLPDTADEAAENTWNKGKCMDGMGE